MKSLYTLVFIVALVCSLKSQSISIFEIDSTNYPIMKAKFLALDKNNIIMEPAIKDLKLTENGKQRKLLSVNCIKNQNAIALSTVLVMDVSGSMAAGSNGAANINLAKKAAESWIRALPLGKSECALTSFDGSNYLIKDFTTNRQNLLDAVKLLKPQGGTNYDVAILEKMAGGLEITRKGQYKKIIVLLSDGMPNFEPKTNEIIAEANKQGCTIFCVTLGMPAPKCMIDMSRQTGGSYFENVTTLAEAQKIYTSMLNSSLNLKPCEIIWESDYECKNDKVNLELSWMSDTSKVDYTPSVKSTPKLNVSPNYVYFGLVAPNTTKDTTITIKALHSNFNITSIASNYSNTDFKVKSPQLPYYIRENETLRLTLSVQPKDSNIAYDYFEIKTDKCDAYLSAAAGELQRQVIKPKLKLLSPNGGESLIIGNRTDITWEGISPHDTVSIDYSIDKGYTWKNITNNATGHKYNWRHNINSRYSDTNVILKIYQNSKNSGESENDFVAFNNYQLKNGYDNSDSRGIITFNQDGNIVFGDHYENQRYYLFRYNLITKSKYISKDYHTYKIRDLKLDKTDNYIYSASEDGSIKKWDAKSLNLIQNFVGHNKAITSFDIDANRLFTSSYDSTIKVWDINSATVTNEFKLYRNYINFNSSENILISISNGKYEIWDMNIGKLKNTINGNFQNSRIFTNLKGNRIIAGTGQDSISIIDTYTGTTIKSYYPYSSYFFEYNNQNDFLIAYNLNSEMFDLINIHTDKILKSIPENYKILKSNYSSDLLLLMSYETRDCTFVYKIYKMSPVEKLNLDYSDNRFKVILPNLQFKEIDFGVCTINTIKDTLVTGSVYNPNDYEVNLDTAYIGDEKFQLVSGMPPFKLNPKSYRNIEYRYKPNNKNYIDADYIAFSILDKYYYQKLKGTPKEPNPNSISKLTKYIDFGKVRVGEAKDTMQVAILKNNSSAPIAIKKITQIGPNSNDFIIRSNTGSFTLAPNETAKMNLRFNAKSKGRTNGNIIIDFADSITSEMVQLFAEGVFEEDVCKGNGFDIRNFENNAQISKLGNTKLTSDSSIFLTESKSNEFGALVANDKISLLNSFVMKFAFRLSKGYNSFQDGSAAGADGLAVVFQGGKNFEVNAQGGGFGYSGLKNTVALELDLYRNKSEFNDPNGNHIALQVPYQDVTTAEHSANRTIAMNDSLFEMRADSTVYYALLRYSAENKRLEFYLDSNKNFENLVLSLDNFNFGKYLIFEQGGFASVGITSSTGASSQAHEILSWSLCSDGNEILSIENDYYNSEEIIQSGESISLKEGKIANVKMHDYLGKTLLSKEVNDKYFDLNSLNLANGVYIISITDELQRKYYRKITINR